jgi:F-type H+-transporting ATPase subunit a
MEEIGVRETIELFGLTFNTKTVVMTWVSMAVVLLISFLATRRLQLVPKGWQNVVEAIVVWLEGQMDAMMGKGGHFLAPFIVSLFLFLIVSNWIGLIPGFASPTNDLNTTLGLALVVICLMHGIGIYRKGWHWIGNLFHPYAVFLPINLIEECCKPITLACRLFGNILAGEILLIVLVSIIPVVWNTIPSVLWLAFSIFIGAVQAVIFTMLSVAYLANAVKDEEA